jgi:hypothetical protein
VSEYATVELEPSAFNAQFYFEDTYVVRLKYKVSLTGEETVSVSTSILPTAKMSTK